MARLIRLGVEVEGEHVACFRSDGLIISTPTGSTAYCVSAGGPLMDISLDVYCVTPICPFLNNFRPLVLPSSHRLTATIDEQAAEVFLTRDGQSVIHLEHGDRVTVGRAEHGLLLVAEPHMSYLRKLRIKGFFEER
jgi:NAD+ kinase